MSLGYSIRISSDVAPGLNYDFFGSKSRGKHKGKEINIRELFFWVSWLYSLMRNSYTAQPLFRETLLVLLLEGFDLESY